MPSLTNVLDIVNNFVQKLKKPPQSLSERGHLLHRYIPDVDTVMSPPLAVGGSAGTRLTQPTSALSTDLLEKKVKRLINKLKKHGINLILFNHDDIRYGPVIGRGGEAVVHSCTVMYHSLPIDAAVKRVLNNSDDAINITLDEIELLCLAGDSVVTTTLQVYGVAVVPEHPSSTDAHLVIVTELGLMNALQLYQSEQLPLAVTLDLWSRLAAAVHCMHQKHIIHQDLKPDNILITGVMRDVTGRCERVDFKVIDLGMGQRCFTDKVATDDILGTDGYHAPEVLLDESHDFRADVFMLGITFSVMLHGPAFLRGSCLPNLLLLIHDAKRRGVVGRQLYESVIAPSLPPDLHLPDSVTAMLCQMLARQQRRSISLPEVVFTCREESARLRLLTEPTLPHSLHTHNAVLTPSPSIPSSKASHKNKTSKKLASRLAPTSGVTPRVTRSMAACTAETPLTLNQKHHTHHNQTPQARENSSSKKLPPKRSPATRKTSVSVDDETPRKRPRRACTMKAAH